MVLVGFDSRFGKGLRCTVADRLRWTFKCNRTLTGTTFLHEYQPPSTPGGGGGVHAGDCNLGNCSLFFVLLLQLNKCFGRERLRANRSYFAPATREWKFVQRSLTKRFLTRSFYVRWLVLECSCGKRSTVMLIDQDGIDCSRISTGIDLFPWLFSAFDDFDLDQLDLFRKRQKTLLRQLFGVIL